MSLQPALNDQLVNQLPGVNFVLRNTRQKVETRPYKRHSCVSALGPVVLFEPEGITGSQGDAAGRLTRS